jgi:hypothetical protein
LRARDGQPAASIFSRELRLADPGSPSPIRLDVAQAPAQQLARLGPFVAAAVESARWVRRM